MQEKTNNSDKHTRIRYTLIFSILVTLYSITLAIVAFPFAKSNIEYSDFSSHYSLYNEIKSQDDILSLNVFLYGINGPVLTAREIEEQDRDMLHVALEALLLPLSNSEIEKGLISYIPRKTELIGVTESNGYVFAEFTNDLIFATDIDKAIKQIEMTINMVMDTQDITIISDGIKINK